MSMRSIAEAALPLHSVVSLRLTGSIKQKIILRLRLSKSGGELIRSHGKPEAYRHVRRQSRKTCGTSTESRTFGQ